MEPRMSVRNNIQPGATSDHGRGSAPHPPFYGGRIAPLALTAAFSGTPLRFSVALTTAKLGNIGILSLLVHRPGD